MIPLGNGGTSMNEVFNKKSLADAVAEELGVSKKAALETVDLVLDTIIAHVKAGNKVDLAGFGKFEIKHRDARIGINPKTKEKISVSASKSPSFKAAKGFKDAVK
jgi:DNA-binding protein HU-beta